MRVDKKTANESKILLLKGLSNFNSRLNTPGTNYRTLSATKLRYNKVRNTVSRSVNKSIIVFLLCIGLFRFCQLQDFVPQIHTAQVFRYDHAILI
jgi:hypothetical protein